MKYIKLHIILLLAFTVFEGFAQTKLSKPKLQFLEDSLLIGKPTPVSFSYLHHKREEVIFPDSAFDFSPFEYHSRSIYPTITTDSMSFDSVVFWLTSFEIDPVQFLRLPVIIYHKKDSVFIYSNTDSILLTELIPVVSDTLTLKQQADFVPLNYPFNYLLITVIVGGFLLILLILGILFRHKIKRFFILRKLNKSHQVFLTVFADKHSKFTQERTPAALEALLVEWKKYIESVTALPYTKLSTKELSLVIADNELIELLKQIDGQLFGNIPLKAENLLSLKTFAIAHYQQKMSEVENAA